MKEDYLKPLLIGAIAYFGIIKPLTDKLGLTKDAASKEFDNQDKNAASVGSYWNIRYWNSAKTAQLLKSSTAIALCKQLWDAKGVFNDDEDSVYAVFKSLKYKSQISAVAAYFYQQYKKDLYTWLKGFLNQEELKTILDYTDNLPTGLK